MQTVIETAVPVGSGVVAFQTASGYVRELSRNEILFEANDLKTCIFQVETGALEITADRADGTVEVIEYALAGDLVGLGFLERHAVTASAAVATTVRELPLQDMDELAHRDPNTKARLDAAVEREFVYRRESLVRAGREQSIVRLAALLCALSRRNGSEGRDRTVLENDLECAVVADYLSITVDVLALDLTQLKMRGLIEPAANGKLRIRNLRGLTALADQNATAHLQSDLPSGRRRLR